MTEEETTLIYVPGNGAETRTFVVSARRMRWIRRGLKAGAVVGGLLIVSWGYFATRSVRVSGLEDRIVELEREAEQVEVLSATLEELESRYGQIQAIFGSGTDGIASEVWLPPPAGGGGDGAGDQENPEPTAWPLTQRGFVTQTLLEGSAPDRHPGLDIAVPADSYIRAAGAGVVEEVGDDPIYGRFVVLDHGNGYRTRYAHANLLLVTEGSTVRRREIIALSGNTGRSSAPHLHFEVHLDGEPVDPLTLVQPPA